MNLGAAATLHSSEARKNAVRSPDHAVETEIKLRLSPETQSVFERHPELKPRRASSSQTHREVTIYFDTPGLVLSRSGTMLRVRRGDVPYEAVVI